MTVPCIRKPRCAGMWSAFPAAVLAAVLLSGNPLPAELPGKPNIVFILADDLGWNDVGFSGSVNYKTPNIDALAKRGMIFTQAYAANALCSPTRASIMSGQYPARLGIVAPACHEREVRLKASLPKGSDPFNKCVAAISATRMDTSIITLAETLKAAGYATGHFGKWHLGPEPYSPLEQGFNVDVPHTPSPGLPNGYLAPWGFPGLKEKAPGEHIEDRMASEAVRFIEANKDRPFYLNYWSFSVHSRYNAKPDLVEKFREEMDEALPQNNPVYAAMVSSLDTAVGTLVKGLEAAGVLDRTLIVFFSDNGGVNWPAFQTEAADDASKAFADIPPTSNAPLRGGKATIYEGGDKGALLCRLAGGCQARNQNRRDDPEYGFLPHAGSRGRCEASGRTDHGRPQLFAGARRIVSGAPRGNLRVFADEHQSQRTGPRGIGEAGGLEAHPVSS